MACITPCTCAHSLFLAKRSVWHSGSWRHLVTANVIAARDDIKLYQSIAQPAEHCRPVLNHGWAVHYCKARPSDKNVSWVILNPLKLAMKINHHPWHRSGLKVLICNTSCPLGTEDIPWRLWTSERTRSLLSVGEDESQRDSNQ